MADSKQIYDFAVKWCDRFRDPRVHFSEIIDDYMGDDCVILDFEVDGGQAFYERYGQAAWDHEELLTIIDGITDIPLLGSAIHSHWHCLKHSSCFDAEILEEKRLDWFVTALTHLAKLSAHRMDAQCKIIPFPEFDALYAEVEKLRTEISLRLLERDELRFVTCKNIETTFMLALGSLEYRVFKLNCEVLRLKRKIDLVQAMKNRQEKIVLSVIEKILDEEFAEFQRELDEQASKMNRAIDHSRGRLLTSEEVKEIKKLYRSIVKALHPDLHPNISTAQIQLFQNAVKAYEDGDLDYLRIISDMLTEPVVPAHSESALYTLAKDKERLTKTLELIGQQIATIKLEYPYTLKELVEDPERLAEKRAELEGTIAELKEAYGLYDARLKEMLR